jgi:Tfp pilus assembly protein PilX
MSGRKTMRRGGALVLALIAILIVGGLGTAFFEVVSSQSRRTFDASESELSFHVAQSGIDDTINKMNGYAAASFSPNLQTYDQADYMVLATPVKCDGGGTKNVVAGSISGGSYTVDVTPAYSGTAVYTLTALGTHNGRRRAVEVVVQSSVTGSLFDYGLFGDVSVGAGGTMTSDGYKSSAGSYINQVSDHLHGTTTYSYANPTGDIGSNGLVDVSGNSKIFGDATPGPGNTVTGGGFVSGSTAPVAIVDPLTPQPYSPPAGLAAASWPAGNVTLGAGVYRYSDINPCGPRTITITGAVTLYVDGNFRMNSNQALYLSGLTAKVTIYHGTGDIRINGQSSIGGNIANAKNFQIFSATTGDIRFNGGAEIYGTVYAPNASFTHNGNASYYGATVAKTINVTGTANFHYDEDLSVVPAAVPPVYVVKSWREIFSP